MSKITFKDFTDVDPDVWYHLSEMRVDKYTDDNKKFGSQLQITDDGMRVFGTKDHYWQFQPVDKDKKNRFAMRCSAAGPSRQLSVCFVPDDSSNGKTQACMAPSNGLDEQKWDVADWGDGVLRFINVQNGTDYWLDVHPGSALFMSDEIDTSVFQPAQRWVMTSAKDVNDGAYSTTFTNTPTSTSAVSSTTTSDANESTTTTSSDSPAGATGEANGSNSGGNSDKTTEESGKSGGVSSGTAIGVGVGVGLAVVLLALLAFFLWRRKRRGAAVNSPGSDKIQPAWAPPAASPYQGSVYPVDPHNYPTQQQQPLKPYNADSYHSPSVSPHPVHGSPGNPYASAYPPPAPAPQELPNTTRPPPSEMMA